MTPSDPLMSLSASDRCGLARRQVLALGVLMPAVVALLSGRSLVLGTQLTPKATREKVSLSDVASQVIRTATACDQPGSKLLTHYFREGSAATTLASPPSLTFVLAVLTGGATDIVAQDHDAFLGLSGKDRDRAQSAIQSSLNRYDSGFKGLDPDKAPDKPLVHLVNRILISDDKELKVRQTYLDAMPRWFSTKIEQVGVSSIKENLDTWAPCNTVGLIPESGIDVTQDTRLVVQNMLLFMAQWESPLETGSTSQRNFTLAGGEAVKTDLIHNTYSTPHATGKGRAVVRLAYVDRQNGKDPDLALDVVLPDAETLPSAMDTGTWAEASTALDKVRPREVELALPKLDLTSEPKELLDFLEGQGPEPKGLDKITPELALARAVQQIRFILDEEDTVTIALNEGQVTAMMASVERIKPVTFMVNHPYMLQLRDPTNGTVLLEATIMDPAVKEISSSV